MSSWEKTKDELRAWLDGRRDGPRTSAACPGCGRQYTGYQGRAKVFRQADEVCEGCKTLLREGLDAREAAAAQADHALYFVGVNPFYDGRSRGNSRYLGVNETPDFDHHPPGQILERAFRKLITSLSADLPIPIGKYPPPLFQHVGSGSPRGTSLWLRPSDAELLRMIDKAIRLALIERTECGEEHGHNILLGLAEGSLSIQKFNEVTTKGK